MTQRGKLGFATLSAALCLGATALWAQTAGQITADSYSPPARKMTGSLVFSGKPGLAPPAGSDQLAITLADVSLSGALPGTEAETAALTARLTGQTIAVSEIFKAASDLEAAYARRGFALARVVIPAQELRDGGSLRLTVVNGFVETIDTSAVPEPLRARLGGITGPLIGKPGLRMNEIERRLLLAGDTFGIALGSALSEGGRPGGTVIILDPEFRSVTGFIGFDNSYNDQLGPLSVSAGAELNGFLGFGEVIYLRGSGNPRLGSDGFFSEAPRLRTLAAGAVLPLGRDGLTFGVEVTSSRTRPDAGGATTQSEFERASLRLFYPWLRTVKRNLSLQAALDMQNDAQDLQVGPVLLPLYRDRSRVLRFSLDGNQQFDNGSLDLGLIFSAGLDAMGARSAADVGPGGIPLSRAGADADFRKLELSLRYRQSIGETWGLSVQGQAQSSFGDAMLSGEQFGLTSPQGLSSFDQGALSGDNGWLLRGELSRSFASEALGHPFFLNPYIFAAAGGAEIVNPTALEKPTLSASAYGLGLDLLLIRDPKFSSASLRIEYGQGRRNDGGKDPERVSLTGSFRF